MSANEHDRKSALAQIVDLARTHDLGSEDIRQALGEGASADAQLAEVNSDGGTPDWVRTLLAMVGGLFVLAGLVGLLHLIWDDLTPITRVLTVFGSGVVLLILGLVASRDAAFERAASPLLLVAGLFQTAGLFVLLSEYPNDLGDELNLMLIFGALSLQYIALFAAMKRTDLLFLLLVSGTLFYVATLAWMSVDEEWMALIIGVSGLVLSFGLERTPWRAVCSLSWVAYAIITALGLFHVVEGHFPLDLLLIAAAALLIQLSVYVGRRALLVTAVVIMLAYLGYYTGEYFADVLGWPIALIAFGLILLALSGYAVRLARGMHREKETE